MEKQIHKTSEERNLHLLLRPLPTIVLYYLLIPLVSKKLKSIISQHKPCGDDKSSHNAGTDDKANDSMNKTSGSYAHDEESHMAKFRDKIMNLKSQIQEDIHELSSEDEQ